MREPAQASNAWKVLAILFLANLVNFFDRAIPAIVMEPLRLEWSLSDLQLGLMAAVFTLTFAVAGIPLGRLADTASRKRVMGWGLLTWSTFTGLAAASWSYWSFLVTRVGVGVGEASYLPAATSLIGDLFPANKRSRAMGAFMLGLPLGLLLAFFSVGAIVNLFGTWRAPFLIAAVPGTIVALAIFLIREPMRGAAEAVISNAKPIAHPIRSVLGIRTIRWFLLAGIASNFAAYATNSFMVPLMQRYFGLELGQAAIATGVIVGVTGLISLTLGAWLADHVHNRSQTGRLVLGGASLAVAACGTWYGLRLGSESVGLFVAFFGFGWLLQYGFIVCVYPALHDVVEPKLRGITVGVLISTVNLAGGTLGPMAVGLLSDGYAKSAMSRAGISEMLDEFKAIGLHDAMGIIPMALLVTSIAIFCAIRSFTSDAKAMQARLTTS